MSTIVTLPNATMTVPTPQRPITVRFPHPVKLNFDNVLIASVVEGVKDDHTKYGVGFVLPGGPQVNYGEFDTPEEASRELAMLLVEAGRADV